MTERKSRGCREKKFACSILGQDDASLDLPQLSQSLQTPVLEVRSLSVLLLSMACVTMNVEALLSEDIKSLSRDWQLSPSPCYFISRSLPGSNKQVKQIRLPAKPLLIETPPRLGRFCCVGHPTSPNADLTVTYKVLYVSFSYLSTLPTV